MYCSVCTSHLRTVPINLLWNHSAISDAELGIVEVSIWISSGCLTLEKTNRNGRSRLIFGCRPRPLGQMLAREPLEHTQYNETLIKAFSTPLIKRQDLLTRVDSCLFFYHWQYVSIKHHCPKYLLASLPQIFVKGLNSFKCVLLHLIYSCS